MTSKHSGKVPVKPAAPGERPAARPARPDPAVPQCSREAGRLAAAILEVLAGVRTPTQAAQVLSLSIPRYYQLEQRALEGLVQACEPRLRGPGVDPQRDVRRLEKQLSRLQQECGRQQALVRAAQRTIGLAPLPAKPAAKPGTTAGTKPGSPAPAEGGKRKRRPRRATVRALKAARACLAAAEQGEKSPSAETSVAVTPTLAVEPSLAASPREETRELLGNSL